MCSKIITWTRTRTWHVHYTCPTQVQASYSQPLQIISVCVFFLWRLAPAAVELTSSLVTVSITIAACSRSRYSLLAVVRKLTTLFIHLGGAAGGLLEWESSRSTKHITLNTKLLCDTADLNEPVKSRSCCLWLSGYCTRRQVASLKRMIGSNYAIRAIS